MRFSKSVSSVIATQVLSVNQSLGGEKKIVSCIACFACSIIVIITYFIVLLNCLYLNPRVLIFFSSPPQPTVGEEQVRSFVVLVAGCQVKT